mmetsp:Transcript_7929/g.17396  ORF Transcript_7929/g.17396 Transcript_7929/m.17396 type:complete len:206 (+) Transcript_7929:140-757(+)
MKSRNRGGKLTTRHRAQKVKRSILGCAARPRDDKPEYSAQLGSTPSYHLPSYHSRRGGSATPSNAKWRSARRDSWLPLGQPAAAATLPAQPRPDILPAQTPRSTSARATAAALAMLTCSATEGGMFGAACPSISTRRHGWWMSSAAKASSRARDEPGRSSVPPRSKKTHLAPRPAPTSRTASCSRVCESGAPSVSVRVATSRCKA